MAQLEARSAITHCVQLLDTYSPDDIAMEEHFFNYMESDVQNNEMNEDSSTFLEEVFVGCQKYAHVLNVIMKGYYAKDGQRSLRSEQNLLKVYAYLSLFRLDEIGVAALNRFVRTQDVHKMYKFLNFLYNDKHIRTWMKDEWNKIYDYTFVQSDIIAPLIGWLPELQEIVKQLKEKIDNKKERKKVPIENTEVKPFNLYKPRPRGVPMPEPIPKLKKSNPVPTTTYDVPKEKVSLHSKKETNRRAAEERFMEASRVQFACANPSKSNKTKQRISDIMSEEDAKLDFERHTSNPLPSNLLTQNIPIRLNAAAILREGKLYQKKEAEELKKLEDLEAGAGDSSKFLEWQSKMRQQDLDNKLADIERRRIEGMLSLEEAILARGNLVKENRLKVDEMKQEAAELMKEYMEKKMIEEQETRQLVETVMDGHENAKEAKRKLQEYKAKIVQEVTEKNKEDMRRALEEAEVEMRQRMELIQQIRAMEAVPVIKKKLVNLTETAGYGLLSEMSIAELRERISLIKVTQREEEEDKRDDIMAQKQAKEKMLNDALDTISRHRTEQSRAASHKLENHKTTRHMKPEIKDPKISELQQKLEAKRAERIREQENSRLTADAKSANRLRQMAKDKKSGEQARWAELEAGQQRLARMTSHGISGSQSASRMVRNNQQLVT